MAFVFRQERGDIPSATAASALGPGSYDVTLQSPSKGGPSYAPFSSSSARDVVMNALQADFTPGPGSYDQCVCCDVRLLFSETNDCLLAYLCLPAVLILQDNTLQNRWIG